MTILLLILSLLLSWLLSFMIFIPLPLLCFLVSIVTFVIALFVYCHYQNFQDSLDCYFCSQIDVIMFCLPYLCLSIIIIVVEDVAIIIAVNWFLLFLTSFIHICLYHTPCPHLFTLPYDFSKYFTIFLFTHWSCSTAAGSAYFCSPISHWFSSPLFSCFLYISGPSKGDPLRCRKTGRYLQHKHFENIVRTGGLNSLPIVKVHGASVRTGTDTSFMLILALLTLFLHFPPNI